MFEQQEGGVVAITFLIIYAYLKQRRMARQVIFQ